MSSAETKSFAYVCECVLFQKRMEEKEDDVGEKGERVEEESKRGTVYASFISPLCWVIQPIQQNLNK